MLFYFNDNYVSVRLSLPWKPGNPNQAGTRDDPSCYSGARAADLDGCDIESEGDPSCYRLHGDRGSDW